MMVILRRRLVGVGVAGYSRFSEPVVIIGQMSNTVTKEYSYKNKPVNGLRSCIHKGGRHGREGEREMEGGLDGMAYG